MKLRSTNKTRTLQSGIRIVILALTIGLCVPALADAITYDVTYDPVSGVTTLFNLPTSSPDLLFWTRLGALAGMSLFLAPGDTVTIDRNGNVSGPYTDPTPLIKNKKAIRDGKIVVPPGFQGTVEVAGLKYNFPPTAPGDIPVQQGDHVQVDRTAGSKGVISTVDAQLTTLTGFVDWCFECVNNGQTNVELNAGGLESSDDTSNFTTILTPNTGTGCPEPQSLWLLGSGLVSVIGFLRRATD